MTEQTIEQRHATNPVQITSMTQQDLRDTYLIDSVFVSGEIRLTYTHHDRIVLGGAVPAGKRLALVGAPEIRSEYFLEHREVGIINVGDTGTVTADDEEYELVEGGCLYLGCGIRDVGLQDAQDSAGAQFYLFSAPAHTAYPASLVKPGDGTVRELGDQLTSNRRSLTQYIHENGIKSCQIVMGVTRLHPGSMWNTMPAHTHDRRTECYLYFDVPDESRVVHLMGERDETRHIVVGDRQAVISPSWSLHSGVGTAAYSFIWAMAGENQAFDDMDPASITDLR